jgi:D-xylose transport system substrate-binding protein
MTRDKGLNVGWRLGRIRSLLKRAGHHRGDDFGATRRDFLIKSTGVIAAAGAGMLGEGTGLNPTAYAQGNKKPFRVAMLLPSFDQQRWKAADGAFFLKRAKELGMDPLPLQASNNDPVLQASQIENLLNQNIDGLVLVPVNVDAAVASVQKANAAGVPVVSHNYIVPNVKLAGVSARDGVELGRFLGNALMEVAPKGNWVVNKGDEGTDIARLKARGGFEVIKPAVDKGDIKIVSDQYMRAWSGDLSRKQMEQALTASNNNIAAVLSYCDCQAYGVVEALRAQGLAGKVPVSGEDGEPEMLKLILKGDAFVTAWTKFDEMGIRSAELLYEALAKEPTKAPDKVNNGAGEVPWYKISIQNVTKDGKGYKALSVAQFAEQNPWWASRKDLGL